MVTENGVVYCPTDPLLHPYGTPRDGWLSSAVLTVVETTPLPVTMSVTTLWDKVTIGTDVGWSVGVIPNIGE